MLMTSGKIHAALILLLSMLVVLAGGASAQAASPRTQKSSAFPQAAVEALVPALRKNDTGQLVAIFGPGSRKIISTGDPVADKTDRERFVRLSE